MSSAMAFNNSQQFSNVNEFNAMTSMKELKDEFNVMVLIMSSMQ